MSPISCIIVDDEPLARQALRRMVERHADLVLAGEASNGRDALQLASRAQPEVIFLDIRMPGMTGLEVARQLNDTVRVIFTTAYDEFAVSAFELQALDYLLKPFGRRRFDQAIERLKETAEDGWRQERLNEAAANGPVRRLFVRERGKLRRIDVDSIAWISAADDYAELIGSTGRHLMAARMHELAERLDPERFIRIHRSLIVNMDRVRHAVPCGNGRWEVEMEDGTVLTTSRSGAARLRESLGT